jgi:glutamyl-tRNA synthetase
MKGSMLTKDLMKPRVRFAPSPTGYLHIGGARTALFNWLYARHHGGTFVLRIEDTDQERSTPESVEAILTGLRWLGIDWDEGPGKPGPYEPYFQMKKIERYREIADQLLGKGLAYRDYTSEEETTQLRKDFAHSKGLGEGDDLRKAGFQYSSAYRDQTAILDKPFVVRFKMQRQNGRFGFEDLVLGRLEKPFDDVDDFVLLRGDGIPLYNFSCVVDDHDMHITHVARGQEHINSTFPQLMLYRALNWEPPTFAHIPLILGPDKEKLSKRRHPEADVMAHKNNGILPHALLNFISRLGWSHGNDEIFTLDQLKEYFDFKQVGKANGVWNPEKLASLNQHWLKNSTSEELAIAVKPWLTTAPPSETQYRLALKTLAPRAKTLIDLAHSMAPYFLHGTTLDVAAAAKHLDVLGKEMVAKALAKLEQISNWTHADLEPIVEQLAQETGAKKGAIAQPIRVAATGNTVSPGIGETLELLGKEETLFRLRAAVA